MSLNWTYCNDRFGRSVHLRADAWFDHILPRHAYLEGNDRVVRRVIEQPQTVTQDVSHSNRLCMYRQIQLPDYEVPEYLKVVVEYTENPYGEIEGTVITAFTLDLIPGEEKRLWPAEA